MSWTRIIERCDSFDYVTPVHGSH